MKRYGLDALGTDNVLYETPVYKIGKHEWKLLVHNNSYYGNVTQFFWRRFSTIQNFYFNPDTEWPKWNGNDTYCGLPLSLNKIYLKHKEEIKKALVESI